MKSTLSLVLKWEKIVLFLLFHIIITNAQYRVIDAEPINSQSRTYTYNRIDEVKKKCSFILDSAPDLKPNDRRIYNIKEDLSFVNGDWWQDGNNEAPIMPFDGRSIDMNTSSGDLQPSKLASFWVTDVARSHPSKKYFSVSAIMQMGIILGGLLDNKPYEEKPRFDIWPGQSQLSIIFQGIYTENSDENGERIMCLLGETMLPSRDPNPSDPWEWTRESGFTNQPPLLQDEQILLVLHYPKTFTLTNRAIRGSLKSLNPKTNAKYFNEVQISSWLGTSSSYEFGSEKLISRACSPSYEDKPKDNGIELYKGDDSCLILQRISNGASITILPNWRCNGTDEFCSKLGPFSCDKSINATDGSFKDFQLVIQDVRCKEDVKNFKVSSVFRVVHPLENYYTAGRRTGLDNITLSAEGEWNSSTGKLCMIGCLGLSNECNSSIILYIPLQFSIDQRSVLMGTISSIEKINSSYFPLSFEMLIRPAELWDQYTAARPFYKYTKIRQAGAVLEKDEPFSFGTVIKKSFLKYPKVETTETLSTGLSRLAEDLTFHTLAYPRTNIQLEIISLGSLFGRYWSNNATFNGETPYEIKSEYTEEQLLLNISAQLTISERTNMNTDTNKNITIFFLEGLYDEHVGKMYLIGCRDVRASWKVLYESMDLENGLDCLVHAIISYPPTTARWLANPTASISISSQRSDDDPLYFKPIKIQTFPLMYQRQREDILSRRGVEGILKILTLSVAIACILSQLFYVRDNLEFVPFISLVMLGVQALGYSLPLITGAETILKKRGSESYESQSYGLVKNQWLQVIDYAVKLLVLASFLITLRIFQKVWKSRIRLLTRAPREPHRVPSDKKVLIITSVIHVIGYIVVLVIHYAKTSQMPRRTRAFVDFDGNSQKVWEWETELEEYMGLVQDFFLLPQIIGNFIWQIDTKPLRKFYFMGLTAVRVLPHIYDFIKSPSVNPYFSEEYEFVNPRYDFYSKFGDVAIPLMGIAFAFIVFAQQRWKYENLRETLKCLPMGSKVYERLPSKSVEAELASGVNGNNTRGVEDGDSD